MKLIAIFLSILLFSCKDLSEQDNKEIKNVFEERILSKIENQN